MLDSEYVGREGVSSLPVVMAMRGWLTWVVSNAVLISASVGEAESRGEPEA